MYIYIIYIYIYVSSRVATRLDPAPQVLSLDYELLSLSRSLCLSLFLSRTRFSVAGWGPCS